MRQQTVRSILAVLGMIALTTNVFTQEQEQSERSERQFERPVDQLEQDVEELQIRIEAITETNDEPRSEDEDQRGSNLSSPREDNTDPVGIKIVGISYHESNSANDFANDYTDWIALVFELTSNLGRNIRAIRGTGVFYDLFDEEWWSLGVTVNDPVPADSTVEWNGRVDNNSYNRQHRLARDADVADIYVDIRDLQLIMADGERIDY